MWQFIILSVAVILGCYLGKLLLIYLQRRKILKDMPTPDGAMFLVGHSHIFETDPAAFYRQVLDYCSLFADVPVFMFWIGPIPMIVCNHPSAVEYVLGSNEIISKAVQYRFLHPWIGFGLLTAPPEKWFSRRKLLTPAFHFSILQSYFSIMNEHARSLLEVIETKLSSLDTVNKKPVLDIFPLIVTNALDIICEAAMGYNLDSVRHSESPYAKAVTRMTDIVIQRMKNVLYYNDTIFRYSSLGKEHDRLLDIIHGFTSNVIKERRLIMQERGGFDESDFVSTSSKKGWRLAFLDLLLHEQSVNSSLTDADIQEEVDTFMFEGHDTTAVAMTWCLYLLGIHPNEQKKLQAELDEVFPTKNCDVSNDHIGKLKYLDKVIKETLRLFPSVPFFGRDVKKEFTLSGHKIPAGSTVMVIPPALHRSQSTFPEPETFDPDRFDNTNRHPYSYVPFSAGPRNCIGAKFAQLELKIVLSWILRHFHVKSLQDYVDCKPAGDIILRPSSGIFLELKHRQ